MLPPTWSRRKRLSQSNGQDVYQYDVIPLPVRIQVVQILRDGLGGYYHPYRVDHIRRCYNFIVRFLRSEFGVHSLTAFDGEDLSEVLFRWFQEVEGIDRWLDGLEASLRIIDDHVRRNWDNFQSLVSAKPDDVITEINARLQEAAIGYQYVSGNIIRIDSTFVHKEVIVPALGLLGDPRFGAAEQEYRAAHEAYRYGKQEECMVGCGKALESVLKVIGGKRGWTIKDTDTASVLVKAAVDAGFLAAYSQASLNHLSGLIQSSTPTLRNKMGGHGAGASPRNVPTHLAAFQLHQTAAVILFLVEQDRTTP